MTAKRFELVDDYTISYDGDYFDLHKPSHIKSLVTVIGYITEENEQLKQTISKIDFAIIRKYDNSLENLLDEIYDGEYNNWIQRQLLRAKKLEKGDVE